MNTLRILGIDPGLYCTGVAYQCASGLRVSSIRPKAGRIHDKARFITMELPSVAWDLVVIERPQVYAGERQKGDPNDLISLAILVGGLECLISTSRMLEVLPHTWKGSTPKNIHHRRIRREAGYAGRASKDALDALGLMLYGKNLLAAEEMAKRKRKIL